jgi:hypothetical protein
VRQWVLSLPIPLHLLLAAQPKLVTPVLQVVHRVITRFLLKQAGVKADDAQSGAVTLIQRFGSAANLNIHLHCLVLDGVYRRGTDGDSDEARTLRPLQAEACTYRIALGPRAGQKVLTVQGAMPREKDFKQTLCADIDGFSLHAAVRCAADDRQALAFMQRLAALVPRPRLHLIRFHGVLAPNAKLRALVVPQEVPHAPETAAPAQEAEPAQCEANCAHHRPVRLNWAKLLNRVLTSTWSTARTAVAT